MIEKCLRNEIQLSLVNRASDLVKGLHLLYIATKAENFMVICADRFVTVMI